MSAHPTKQSREKEPPKLDVRVIDKIKEALGKRGWNPTDLARGLKHDASWASHLMNSKRGLSVNQLIKVAELLKVTPQSLLPDSEDPITFEEYVEQIAEEKARRIIKEELKKYKKNK